MAYRIVPRDGYSECDLLRNEEGLGQVFSFTDEEVQPSPYLYNGGEPDDQGRIGFYLTRTVHLGQEADGDRGVVIKGQLEYTEQTGLFVRATVTQQLADKSLRGLFKKETKVWSLLGREYEVEEGTYQFSPFKSVEVPPDMKKSQFLLDLRDGQAAIDPTQLTLLMAHPFVAEQANEFEGQGVPTTVLPFAGIEATFYPPFALPARLVELTLKGSSTAPLVLTKAQAEEISKLVYLRTLVLENVTIGDGDLAIALRPALQHVTLKGITSALGSASSRRLVELIITGSLRADSLTLPDPLQFALQFYQSNPTAAQLQAVEPLFTGKKDIPGTAEAAKALGDNQKVNNPAQARVYYRIGAGKGSRDAAYELAMMIKEAKGGAKADTDTKDALALFEQAAGADGKGHLLAAYEAANIHQEGKGTYSWSAGYVAKNAIKTKLFLKAIADQATATKMSDLEKKATLQLADLLNEENSAQAKTYYQKFEQETGCVSPYDSYKGKALLAHGKMFLDGKGGAQDYEKAIAKLAESKRFSNVRTEASKEWGRAHYEWVNDLLSPPSSDEEQGKASELLSDEVIEAYPQAEVIRGFKNNDRAIFEKVLAFSDVTDYSKIRCHHALGTLYGGDVLFFSGPTDLPTALYHSREAVKLTKMVQVQLQYANTLQKVYQSSLSKHLKLKALNMAGYYATKAKRSSETKDQATSLLAKIDKALGDDKPRRYEEPDTADLI